MFVSIIFRHTESAGRVELEVKDTMGRAARVYNPRNCIPEDRATIQWFLDRIDQRESIAEGSEWRNGYMSLGDWSGMRFTFPR